jgi:acetyl esterase/lipase
LVRCIGKLAVVCVVLVAGPAVRAEERSAYTRTADVVYGKKYGMALTLDVFTPKQNANGAGVLAVVSGGYFSNPGMVNPAFYGELLKRGYTVFAVLHGSQPRYTIPEIVADINRSTRFVRYHARDYQVDPERLGIVGASAGGHLSLMQGTAGDQGNPKATDPVERTSSRVQAVACFFPPSDFLNFGGEGQLHWGDRVGLRFRAAFDYHEFDPQQGRFVRITDLEKVRKISRDISPVTHVTADDPPTLVIHGTKDRLVPFEQAERIVARLKEAGVPVKLVVKEGADHGWLDMIKDVVTIADWFDQYLVKPAAEKPAGGQQR